MAIEPGARYPGQTDVTDPNMPFGKARNVSAPGAGDGFPLEEDWVNDVLGWIQDLLTDSGGSFSGVPEEVGASQINNALRFLTRRYSARYALGGTPDEDEKFELSLDYEADFGAPDFSVTDDEVTVPDENGWYLVTLSGSLAAAPGTNPFIAALDIGTDTPLQVLATRFTGNNLVPFQVQASALMRQVDFGKIAVFNRTSGGGVLTPLNLTITIIRMATYTTGIENVW